MGSELLAESLAMHWVLVLNFEWFPRYASVNVGYFPGNSNGLGYSNPSEDQSSLPCAAANTLILPCAQGRAAPLGSRTVPTAHGRTKPCILTRHQHTASASQYLHSSGARPWERAQMRSEWEMHRKTPRRNSRQRQGPATKPGHIASTTLLRKIWPDNLKAFTNSPISLPQVKHTYRCLLDNKPELCSELCHSPVTHMASGEEQFNSTTINECNFFCPFFLTSISWLCFPLLSLAVPAECWNSCPGCLLSQPLLGQLLCAHLDKELCPTQQKSNLLFFVWLQTIKPWQWGTHKGRGN